VILSDRDLREALATGQLTVTPFPGLFGDWPDMPAALQPASLELTLHNELRVFNSHLMSCIDPRARQDELTRPVTVADGEPFVLHPGEFVLAATVEEVTLGDSLAARLDGTSSLGRVGLLVHSTAGFIDPGFTGRVTLELSNVATLPLLLWPGDRIAQLCVQRLTSPAARPYGTPGLRSRYQGQGGPEASRAWMRHLSAGPDRTLRP
jgi:dCTP deaminase